MAQQRPQEDPSADTGWIEESSSGVPGRTSVAGRRTMSLRGGTTPGSTQLGLAVLVVGLGYAAVSAYWAVGGKALLHTVAAFDQVELVPTTVSE